MPSRPPAPPSPPTTGSCGESVVLAAATSSAPVAIERLEGFLNIPFNVLSRYLHAPIILVVPSCRTLGLKDHMPTDSEVSRC